MHQGAYQNKQQGDEEVKTLHNILAGQLEQLTAVKPLHDSAYNMADLVRPLAQGMQHCID